VNCGTGEVKHSLEQRRRFLIAWGLIMATKLILAVWLPVFGDEAFYWWEGQHLAWAYSDLPGATAWLARLSVELLGTSPFGLRALFILAGGAVPWLLVRIARRWFGTEAGWRAGWLGLLLPLVSGMGLLAVPDVLLTLATVLCLDAIAALAWSRSRSGTAPLPVGALIELSLGLALGASSHYRFVVVIAAGGLALLLAPSGRALLRQWQVWLSGLVGTAAWLPLIVWNWQNRGAGLSFQVVERHPWQFSPEGLLFIVVQAAIVSPVLWLLLLWAARIAWRRRQADIDDDRWTIALVCAAVPLIGYFVLGFFADRERISLHWPLPAYLALVPVLATQWPTLRQRWRSFAVGLAVATQAGLLLWLMAAILPGWRMALVESKAYPAPFSGWNEVTAATRDALRDMPADTLLVADNFMLGAQLAFALYPRSVQTLAHAYDARHGRDRQLALWGLGLESIPQRPALLVTGDRLNAPRDRLAAYHRLCERLGSLPSPQVLDVDRGRNRFLLYRLKPSDQPGCVLPALAYVDSPTPGARVEGEFEVRGWAFKDGAGVARVDVLIDGVQVVQARYGEPMPHVAEFWKISTDPAHPNVGFVAHIDASQLSPGRRWLSIRVHGRDGSREPMPGQSIQVGESSPR
jgi:4-amino-4-deoxy-L-arabinose transferase-like glycosyltransferase